MGVGGTGVAVGIAAGKDVAMGTGVKRKVGVGVPRCASLSLLQAPLTNTDAAMPIDIAISWARLVNG